MLIDHFSDLKAEISLDEKFFSNISKLVAMLVKKSGNS